MDNPILINADQILKMVNLRRHDWLNHIQVLLGQHSMQNYEEIRAYLNQLVDQLQNENHIARLGNSNFSLDLLTYPVRYPEIQFEVVIPEVIQLHEYGITDEVIGLIRNFLNCFGEFLSPESAESPSLLLTMGKIKDQVLVTLDFVGHLRWELMEESWNKIKTNLEAQGVKPIEKVKRDNEWVVDLIMGVRTCL